MRKLFFVLLLSAATALGVNAVTVQNTAGSLYRLVSDTQITQLTVTGTMDASDFLFITNELNELTALDLSQVTIVPCDRGQALYGTVMTYAGDEIPRTAFFGKKLTSVSLPVGLKTIGYASFAGCYQLQSVSIPATVTFIDDYAFAGSALTAIELPATIQGMGKGVFARCEALQSATIDAQYVGDFAFLGDTHLSNVSLGGHVKYILRGVFNGCTALQSLNIDPSCRISRIDEEAFINSGLSSIDIVSAGVGTIGDWAFAQTHLSSMSLPNGMTDLGEGALAHNPMLSTVTFPGMGHAADPDGRGDGMNPGSFNAPAHHRTLTEVKDYTFAGDSELNAGAMLKNGVTRLGAFALYNVSQEIDTMRLPASIAYLGDRAMAGMIGMQVLKTDAVDVPELGTEVWAGVDQPSVLLLAPDAESTELYKAADQWMNFFFQTQEDFILGDVNGDGMVDVTDVTNLIAYVLGNNSDINVKAGDINDDGTVDVSDVTALISMILNSGSSKSLNSIRAIYNQRWDMTGDVLVVPPVTLRAGQTRTVEVALNNDERDYTAVQFTLVLPQGVKLAEVKGIDRGNGHTFMSCRHTLEENVYTIMGVSLDMKEFAGNEGNVLSLTITASDDFTSQDAELLLTNTVLVTDVHQAFIACDARAKVSDPSGVEQVTADKEIAAVRYINVAGQESDMPFSGVNIVVTTYTDGTTSTVKVIK